MRKFEIVIIDSKELQRVVKVYVKVPKSYYETKTSYPVLYIHDGQVAFNDYENNEITWGLLDDYVKSELNEVILVGIANPDTRIDELCPFVLERKGKEPIGGKTDLYFKFITNTLMTYINNNYRTLKGKEHTGMMGVSLGGLTTIYAMIKQQNTFSKYAIISSAHHRFQKELLELLKETDLQSIQRVYSDVGTLEAEKDEICEKYITSNIELNEVLQSKLKEGSHQFKIIEESKHEFDFWSKRIPEVISFMFPQ